MSRKHRRNKVGITPHKDAAGGVYWGQGSSPGFFGAGIAGRNTNIQRTSWGAATAYAIIPEVNRAMTIRADAVGSLRWEILYKDNDGSERIVATSDDSTPRHALAAACHNAYGDTNRNLFSLMTYAYDLTGEIFIQKCYTEETGRGLKWLNPLGCSLLISEGRINQFQYTAQYGGGSETLWPREMAYYHSFSPQDDFHGQGLTQVVMGKINIARNLDDFVEDFFGNNARPSVIVSPTGEEPFSTQQKQMIQQQMDVFLKGRGNQWSTYVAPINAKYDSLDQPKIGDHYTIAGELSQYIYTIYGVPKAIAGDDSGTQYKTSDDVKVAFFQITVIPLATHIERFINHSIMPYFDQTGALFRFDTSEFDLVSDDDKARMDIATKGWDSGLLTWKQGRTYSKHAELGDDLLTGDYLKIEGVPVPLIEVPNYWKYKLLTKPAPAENAPVSEALGVSAPENMAEISAPADVPKLPATIPGKSTQVNAEDELRAWERKIRQHKYKAVEFEPLHLKGGVGRWITHALEHSAGDESAIKALFGEAREWITDCAAWSDDRLNMLYGILGTIKTFEDTAEAFFNSILQTIAAGQSDEISRAKFGGAMRSALRRFGLQAFRDGMQEGGLDPESMDATMLKAFRDWQDEQSGYVSNFAKEMYSVGITPDEIERRAKLWVNKSLESIRYRGLAIAAPEKRYTWKLGLTEDHCATCLANNGQTDSMKAWVDKGLPQSDALECKGFNCDCRLLEAT